MVRQWTLIYRLCWKKACFHTGYSLGESLSSGRRTTSHGLDHDAFGYKAQRGLSLGLVVCYLHRVSLPRLSTNIAIMRYHSPIALGALALGIVQAAPHERAASGLHTAAVAAGKLYFGSATDNSELTDTAYVNELSNTADWGQITPANSMKAYFETPCIKPNQTF